MSEEERFVSSPVTTVAWWRDWVRRVSEWSSLGTAQTQPVGDAGQESAGKWSPLWYKVRSDRGLRPHPEFSSN